MLKYVLLILTLFIILLSLQLIVEGEAFYGRLIDYYKVNILNKKSEKVDYKEVKNNNFPKCPTKELTLLDSWNYYKDKFISSDGRVIDYQRNSVSTSEGQAYAMLRSLLMRDKITFDKTYNWARYNLQHKTDKLFAWLWGQKLQGQQRPIEYGILDQNGASDAGVEIAACLILASKVWNQSSYLEDAKEILNDIWDKETIVIKGERILSAGINQNKNENVEINPSYFMPHNFRIFAEVDKKHDWHKLVDSSYRLTNWCIDNIKTGLPPDIFYINRNTGAITFDKDKSDFSYDAVRVFYRFYIDYQLTKDPRAVKLLSRSKLFIDVWEKDGKFYTSYKQNGELKNYDEAIGSIALLLPVINMYDRRVAKEIYKSRIREKYNNEGFCGDPLDYYAQNLVWLGNWLYLDEKNIKSFKY